MRWGGRGTVLRRDADTHGDMQLIRFLEVADCASQIVLFVRNSSDLAHAALDAHILEYDALPHSGDRLHLLANFEYCRQEINFGHRLRKQRTSTLLVIWHCIDILELRTRFGEMFRSSADVVARL